MWHDIASVFMMPKIPTHFIVGMPGSGKTTIGRELAKSLHMKFIDLDEEIVKMGLGDIETIFKAGEPVFRYIEKDAFFNLFPLRENAIVSLGGGSVEIPEIRKYIKKFETIYIKHDLETLESRLKKSRPILRYATTEELLKRRTPLYEEVASWKVIPGNTSVEDQVKYMVKVLEKVWL